MQRVALLEGFHHTAKTKFNKKRADMFDKVINSLRTLARKFSNIDFFLKISPLKDDDLVMSEM